MAQPSDVHWDATNGVLLNTRGITDLTKLARIVTETASVRLLQLHNRPVGGTFDSGHLQAIHRYIFQDIFPWAGEFRTVTTARGDGASFAAPAYIEPSLERLFAALTDEQHLCGLRREEFALRAAHYLGEINAVHAFRDGNGRTQREFIRTLALSAGYQLTWANLTPQEINQASRLHFHTGDSSTLASLILERLS